MRAFLRGCVTLVACIFCLGEASSQITETKFYPDSGARGDHFGRASAISGTEIAVGALISDSRRGSAYLFELSGGSWSQAHKFEPSDGSSGDRFGRSIDIDGDVIVVGAEQHAGAGSESGAVYVYHRVGGAWQEFQKLIPSDASAFDRFGTSIGVSGNYLVSGAYYEDENGSNAGAAYVFEYDGTSWTQEAKLLADDGEANDQFGFSADISGDRAIVGAWGADDDRGAAYIFRRDGDQWIQEAKLSASDAAAGDHFGSWWISISGDYAVVGALNKSSGTGAAYIYHRDGGTWVEQTKLVPAEAAPGDEFGTSTGIDGEIAIVGSFEGEYAYLYKRTGSTWNELARLSASDGFPGQDFGYTSGISGGIAFVGADDDNIYGPSSGSVYVYEGFLDQLTVSDIPDQTVNVGDSFSPISLDDFVTDPDYPDTDIAWTFSGNVDLTVSIVDRVATVDAPSGDWTGSESITFTATNPTGSSASDAATFIVEEIAPEPPTVSDIPDQTIESGATFDAVALDDFVTDPVYMDSEITWSFTGNVELLVSIVDRVATVETPAADWTGSESITFTATNPDGLSDSDAAAFAVTEPGGGGSAPQVSDIPDITVAEGPRIAVISLDEYVEDPDNTDSEITWSVTGNSDLRLRYSQTTRTAWIRSPAGWVGSETLTFTATDPDGNSDSDIVEVTVTGHLAKTATEPLTFGLDGSYPSPFNPSTRIVFTLPMDSPVQLSVFDVLGKQVRVLVSGTLPKGRHEAFFDGSDLTSGVYLYRLEAGALVDTRTTVLIK